MAKNTLRNFLGAVSLSAALAIPSSSKAGIEIQYICDSFPNQASTTLETNSPLGNIGDYVVGYFSGKKLNSLRTYRSQNHDSLQGIHRGVEFLSNYPVQSADLVTIERLKKSLLDRIETYERVCSIPIS